MPKKMSTICMIGCGGFIGSHLVDRFLSRGTYKIYGIDICKDKINHCLENKRFTYINMDIKNYQSLRPYIKKSDCVISLAALCNPSFYNTIPLDVVQINFFHSFEIVKLCCELKKWLIHFSTCEVYGKTLAYFLDQKREKSKLKYFLLQEDSTPLILGPIHAQRWIYACAKELLERTIYAYSFEEGLEYTIIRPFNFIGPEMDYIPGIEDDGVPRVLACFTSALLLRKPLQLVMDGRNKRVFTYIQDAVDAIELMVKEPEKSKGQIFNIGNPNNETTIRNLAHKMIKIYQELLPEEKKFKFHLKNVSSKEFYGEGYEDSDRRVPDITKAQSLLGWKPKFDLNETLKTTLDYYIKKYKTTNGKKHIIK